MKRIALYVFWDKNKIVHDYVKFYLTGLKEVSQEIIFIANGGVENNSFNIIKSLNIDIITRSNIGYDFSGWREALYKIGFNNLYNYDEIILCNSSCYGPIFPFSLCFNEMKNKKCDFWGLYRHPSIKFHFPEHLQSYFIVIRKKLLCSQYFFDYWKNLNTATTWNDAVYQETRFTKFFEKKGFVSQAYINNCKSSQLFENPSIPLGHKLIYDNKFPVLKRKIFSENYNLFFSISNASQSKEAIEIIKNTNYPVEYIYSDILKTMQNSHIRKILHHTFVLDDNILIDNTSINSKVAIIILSYFEDSIDEIIPYICSMPTDSDAFIVVTSNKMEKIWKDKKNKLPNKNISIRLQQNRGRNEAAYWITCKDVILNYDFICLAHDKKSISASPPIRGYYFSRHCWDNILKSKEYVSSIIDFMQKNPMFGILMPPTLVFGKWGKIILNNEWTINKKKAFDIYNKLKLQIPFDNTPDAPWGSMFWIRGKAMTPFYRYNWSLNDFPKEPLKKNDGTVLHALERMYPMIAQEAGYFTAWIMPSSEAGVHFDNIYHISKNPPIRIICTKLLKFIKDLSRKIFTIYL